MFGSKQFLTMGLMAVAAWAMADTDIRGLKRILVVPNAPKWEAMAAETLQKKLEGMFSVKLPLETAGEGIGEADAILVGKAAVSIGKISTEELQAVKCDGFVLKAANGVIALAGYRPCGSIYGAYRLLEKLGYRFYAPDCEVIPQNANPILADMVFTDKPSIEFRYSGGGWPLGNSIDDLGDPRKALNPELFKDSNLWFEHTSGYLLPLKLYFKDHPEYFSMRRDGSRKPTMANNDSYLHLCMSDAAIVGIAIERTLRWMRLQPERRFFYITQGDGNDWCQCEKCKAQDITPGNYSDRMLIFVNQIAQAVAKEFPDNRLLTLAYCGTEIAPVKAKPAANIIVLYCPYWGIQLSMIHSMSSPFNSEALKQFCDWHAVTQNIGLFPYNYLGNDLPSWDAMATDIKWGEGQKLKAISCCGDSRSFRTMFQYLFGKLTWDPSLDLERLKAEFVKAYYGSAAPYVTEYLAKVKARLAQGFPRGQHEGSMPAGYYAGGFFQESLALFDKMAEAAKGDPKALARVQCERELLEKEFMAACKWNDRSLRPEERKLSLKLLETSLHEELDKLEAMSGKAGAPALGKQLAWRLLTVADVAVPENTSPAAVVREFLADPEGAASKYPAVPAQIKPQAIPDGLRLPASCFSGGYGPFDCSWYCPSRQAMAIYSSNCPRPSTMKVDFNLTANPKSDAVLKFEANGGDKDLEPKTSISILLNGKEIFCGPAEAGRHDWYWQTVKIPDGLLKNGTNTLEFKNIMTSRRVDHYWLAISEARIGFK